MSTDGPTSVRRVGILAGSFDPFTLGHEDLVRRALHVVDWLVVAVASNGAKSPMFPAADRAALAREVIAAAGLDDRVAVREFAGLLVDLATEVGATVLVRGVRGGADFDYEMQMARMNRQLAAGVETVLLVPDAALAHVSSTFARDLARHGADLSGVVRPAVERAMRARMKS